VRTLSCEEIVSELERNFEFLATTELDVPERHRSMGAVFAHSWELLSPSQQAVFQNLSVFRGGFHWEAVKEVCRVSIRDLAILRDKSFLHLAEDKRYTIHEMMRLFAHEKLAKAHPETISDTYRRHCRYYLHWLAGHEEDLYGQEPHLAVESIQGEIENVRHAWQWATTSGEWQTLTLCLQAWIRFYHLRGLYAEAESWLEEALDGIQPQPEQIAAASGMNRLRGYLLVHMADILVMRAKYREALGYAHEADELAERCTDSDLKARAQAVLGLIYGIQGEYGVALFHQQQAHDLWLGQGECRQFAHLLLQTGKTYEKMYNWERAQTLHSQALQMFEEMGDRWRIATGWGAMGSAYFGAGNFEQALYANQQALEMAQQMNAQAEIVRYTSAIGTIYWRMSLFKEALHAFSCALALAADIGLAHRVSNYHRIVGEIHKDLGQFAEARMYLEKAVHLAEQVGATVEHVAALAALGFVYYEQGNHSAALQQYLHALQVAERLGEPHLIALSMGRIGFAYAQLGQFQQAQKFIEQAIDGLQPVGDSYNTSALVIHLRHLAVVLHEQGDYSTAESYCRTALKLIHETGGAMFMGQTLTLRTTLTLAQCRHAQGYQSEAVEQMSGLLELASTPKERIMVLEILWQLTKERGYVERLLLLYHDMQEQQPRAAYQKSIEALEQVLGQP
jgi:tetratricopeptide (TPR) repeat protein